MAVRPERAPDAVSDAEAVGGAGGAAAAGGPGDRPMSLALPVGINPTTIGVSADWWLQAVRRAERLGLASAWAWDHFVSRGRRNDPVLECWALLAAAVATTSRIRLGSLVTNVMNRHPALLARMLATLADLAPGRIELGIGIGGHPGEHQAYGIDFPAADERWERLEEAISVLRLLFTGGPADYAGRFHRLTEAHAFPVPVPPPRIIVAGDSPAGAGLAARVGDAWTCAAADLERLGPVFGDALAQAGREPSSVALLVRVSPEELMRDPVAVVASLAQRGAREVIIEWVHPAQLDRLLAALERHA